MSGRRNSLVDRRIDLDEVVIRTGADIATARRHDAGCDGAAKTKRISDRKHPVANAWGLVRQLYIRKWTIFDLDQRADQCADRLPITLALWILPSSVVI